MSYGVIPQSEATVKRGRKRKIRNSSVDWQIYSLCAIPFLLIFVLNYLPMFGLILAFKDYRYSKGIFGSKWCGFDKFKFIFESNEFLNLTKNTLFLNGLFIVVGTLSAVTLAVLLFEVANRKATKVYQTILIAPQFISWVIVAYLVYALLNVNYGFLNRIILFFGGQSVDWYSKPEAWPIILTISSVWKSAGYSSVVYYAALMGIDYALFEAAEIDGANKWHVFKSVMVPCLKPLLILFTIMNIGQIFRSDFGLFYQVPRNIPALYNTTQVIDTYIFRVLREVNDMGLGTAVGLLQSVVGLVLVLVTNYTCEKIEEGSGMF